MKLPGRQGQLKGVVEMKFQHLGDWFTSHHGSAEIELGQVGKPFGISGQSPLVQAFFLADSFHQFRVDHVFAIPCNGNIHGGIARGEPDRNKAEG